MKILILGRHEVLYDSAVSLSKEHEIVGIITAPASDGYLKDEQDFAGLAEKLNCPFLLVREKGIDLKPFIKKLKPDIGVSVNWVYVVGKDLIGQIPKGILNLHSGDLPKYKGNAVSNWALLLNEKEIGLSVHLMKPGEIDCGDIVLKRKIKIDKDTTIGEVVSYLHKNAPLMFMQSLKRIGDKNFKPLRQKGEGFRCFPRLPIDGKINWNKPAEEIHNLIRATTHPYAGAYTFLKIKSSIKKVYIWKSRVVAGITPDLGYPGQFMLNDQESGETHILCGRGIIAIKEAQYEGRAIFKPGKFWKSIRLRFGLSVEDELFNLRKLLLKS